MFPRRTPVDVEIRNPLPQDTGLCALSGTVTDADGERYFVAFDADSAAYNGWYPAADVTLTPLEYRSYIAPRSPIAGVNWGLRNYSVMTWARMQQPAGLGADIFADSQRDADWRARTQGESNGPAPTITGRQSRHGTWNMLGLSAGYAFYIASNLCRDANSTTAHPIAADAAYDTYLRAAQQRTPIDETECDSWNHVISFEAPHVHVAARCADLTKIINEWVD